MPQGKVEKVAFGASGIIREPSGRLVFVPATLPQEHIEYEIEQAKPDFAKGRLLNIIKPHPLRHFAPCPHFGVCNGCELQHASYELQLQLKQQWLQEQFRRIAKLDIDMPPIQGFKPWAYRRSVEWSFENGQLGYKDAYGNVFAIYRCLLIENDLAALELVKELLAHLKITKARIRWVYQEKGLPILALETPATIDNKIMEQFWRRENGQLAGLLLHKRRKIIRVYGQHRIKADVLGLEISWDSLGFLQNHFEGSLAFYQWLIDHLGSGGNLLDLYCGVGITSLLAAKRGWQVTGMEISPVSIELAKENARANRLDACCRFSCCNLSQKPLDLSIYDVLLTNPPREGMTPALVENIGQSHLRRVLYLSCHPATLARDVKALTQVGFSICALQAFDCFGQTTHFETAIALQR